MWKTAIEDWHDGYGITSAPLYYDGIAYGGITGSGFGARGRLTALDTTAGKIPMALLHAVGAGRGRRRHLTGRPRSVLAGGATIWNTSARDPQLRLVYFAVGNCGPDYDGAARQNNLFCASIVALNAKTGEHVWQFQEVHHDISDYDTASPVVLFDTTINAQPRRGIAQAGRTGWVYILDRTNEKTSGSTGSCRLGYQTRLWKSLERRRTGLS